MSAVLRRIDQGQLSLVKGATRFEGIMRTCFDGTKVGTKKINDDDENGDDDVNDCHNSNNILKGFFVCSDKICVL